MFERYFLQNNMKRLIRRAGEKVVLETFSTFAIRNDNRLLEFMNTRSIAFLILAVFYAFVPVQGKTKKKTAERCPTVEEWSRFEVTLHGPRDGNPFLDVSLTADFVSYTSGKKITVRGFYDGEGVYKLRFMPVERGDWRYTTHSNVAQLNGLTGRVEATTVNHGAFGMVRAVGREFRYQDNTPFFPVGTTAYAWIYMPEDVQRQTLRSLRMAHFNKVRMCIFPKHYALCKEMPKMYPYEIVSDKHDTHASVCAGGNEKLGSSGIEFDKSRFNPDFFHHLEQCLDSLDAMGCEADLILFHPYDKGFWGFDGMSMKDNKLYLQYVEARLSSFKNVWWSLANEYDYCKAKTMDDWGELIRTVKENDPYGHLVSIHGSTANYFPYEKYGLTHASIQDEGPVAEQGRASVVRNIYSIPVIFDEVRYEGNLHSRWGRMSGEEMIASMWNGLTQGTYVSHGECFQNHAGDYDTIFWAKGGRWRGEAWKRIPFMRKILADLPHPMQMADVSRDELTSTAGPGYYIVYFGDRIQDSWLFSLPQKNASYERPQAGERFTVEIIDTWNMTSKQVSDTFELGEVNDYRFYDKQLRRIRLPKSPYIMLRIKQVKQHSDDAYIFTSFREPSIEGLRYLYSYDGLHWDSIPGEIWKPTIGNREQYTDAWTGKKVWPHFAPDERCLRDPSIIQGPDGIYRLVWTAQWMGSRFFGYASSEDLIHWKDEREIHVMDSIPTNNVWAPELFYDDELNTYFIIWSSQIPPSEYTHADSLGTNNANRLWMTTTKDFKTFTPAVRYYDPGFNSIDAFMLKRGHQDYVLVLKDNRKPGFSNLFCAFAESPYGPFHSPSQTFGRTFSEGPCAVKLADKWYIYFDQYRPQGYTAVSTTDFRRFSSEADNISVPLGHKHGTIVKVKRNVLQKILDTFGK